jgi:hypothetical protein
VEGFAGSAIQLEFIEKIPNLPEDLAVVLVHILNPFGMAWLRRVNENNVDLNRNFLKADEQYRGAPSSYKKFDNFLNPPTPPTPDFLPFVLKAQILIARYGLTAMTQAVAGGQYEFFKGLFFGGERMEEGPAKYRTFLESSLSSANHIVAIDVHTGLGKYGEDTLLVEPEQYPDLRKAFGEKVAPSAADKGPAYRVRGGIHGMILNVAPHATVECVCQEFGTFSPIRILHTLRQENRWHHYASGDVMHRSKKALKDAFCPPDESWQRSVLTKGRALIAAGLDQLAG